MKKLCLVIDMINDFRNGAMPNPRMERIIPKIADFLERKAKEGLKIYFICDSHNKGDRELRLFPAHGMKGTEGSAIIHELQKFVEKDGSNFVPKNFYSGLFGTSLLNIFFREKPEEIILVGVCTDICVLHTAIDLYYMQEGFDFGIKVRILRDCVETYDMPGHNADKLNKVALNHIEKVLGFEIVNEQEKI